MVKAEPLNFSLLCGEYLSIVGVFLVAIGLADRPYDTVTLVVTCIQT